MRSDDRGWRGAQHGAHRARLDGCGFWLRRRRPVRNPGSANCGRAADHRGRSVREQTRDGQEPRRDAYRRCLTPGGTTTIIGMIPVGQKVEIDGAKLLYERTMQGSNMGSNRFRVDMPRYIDFYLQGRLNLDDMISRRGKLEDVNDAFASMKNGEVARTVLMFDN